MESRYSLSESIPRAVFWMLGSVLGFTLMSVLVKTLAREVSNPWMVFSRGFVNLAFMGLWGGVRGDIDWRPTGIRVLLVRGLAGFLGVSCLFYAVSQLPLPVATVMNWSSTLFVVLFARVFLSERLPRGGLFLIVLSLFGLTQVVGLSFAGGGRSSLPWIPVGAALLGAMSAGAAYTAIRAASSRFSSSTIIFYFSLVTTVLAVPGVLLGESGFPQGRWLELLSVGAFATAGQMCMTRAYRFAPAPLVSVMMLLNAPLSAIFGYFLFDEALLLSQWLGIILVGLSIGGLAWLQSRRVKGVVA